MNVEIVLTHLETVTDLTAAAKDAELHRKTLAVIGTLRFPRQITRQQQWRLNQLRNQLTGRINALSPEPAAQC